MNFRNYKIQNYKMINSAFARFREKELTLQVWQSQAGKTGENERLQAKIRVKDFKWNEYLFEAELQGLGYEAQYRFDATRPLYIFIAEERLLFKTTIKSGFERSLRIYIPDEMLLLREEEAKNINLSKPRVQTPMPIHPRQGINERAFSRKRVAFALTARGLNPKFSIMKNKGQDKEQLPIYDLARGGVSLVAPTGRYQVGEMIQVFPHKFDYRIIGKVVRKQELGQHQQNLERIGVKFYSIAKGN